VLVNSNPATIMTDSVMADRIYIEPITPEFVEKIIDKERPDGMVATLGGQVGLNLAFELSESGVLSKYNVKLLGTSLDAVKKSEDRELFKDTMKSIGQPIPESTIVRSVEEAVKFAEQAGYPLIVRPAYTLGGTGGGIAGNLAELEDIAGKGLKHSMIGQILLEKSVAGWREIEYEAVRDSADNCIIVCNMENIDPVGIHTGDSIVIAPTQTLSAPECKMLRNASIDIVRALGIEGSCNVQFALDTDSMDYVVIEVNPRVSRSSALASKATGYPIAKVATKIAVGYRLDEIDNAVTGKTKACFEPSIDYVVIKFPRWPFDKFSGADKALGTQMKATGEVMAIDRSIEGALMKAVRSLEIGAMNFSLPGFSELSIEELLDKAKIADDGRFFAISELLHKGVSIKQIHDVSKINEFFLRKLANVAAVENALTSENGFKWSEPSEDVLRAAKNYGFTDGMIAKFSGADVDKVRSKLKEYGISVCYKMVDTCAAEFDAVTPYYYSSCGTENEALPNAGRKIIVLGSGPIRIGQGIEFDYCAVHAVQSLKKQGIEAIIINNNPETVSTDFDTSDRLYFEPLTLEDVLRVCDHEKPEGVLVQFGGQTAINLAQKLHDRGVNIIGTSVDSIDRAENRERFDEALEIMDIPRPLGASLFSAEEAAVKAKSLGYPVIVRPSYVLGGRAMEIVHNEADLLQYMRSAVNVSPEHPVLMDRYMRGVEIEVDAIADGETVVIPGIMKHVERAGVHSGDSIAVYPAKLESRVKETIIDYTRQIALELGVKGLLNIQYVLADGNVYVLEVNPRASRTVPILSKVTGIPMVDAAVRAALGESLLSQGYSDGLAPEKKFVAVKAPVFSFGKMTNVEISLGPEMKSTGEVMGIGTNYEKALFKALRGSGLKIPESGTILFNVADIDKLEAYEIALELKELGYDIVGTSGTADYFTDKGLPVPTMSKSSENGGGIIEHIKSGRIKIVVNTFTKGKEPMRDGFKIRRAAVEHAVPCFTSLDTMSRIVKVLKRLKSDEGGIEVNALQDFV
ncbi:MAG: carbamoyl-phosphate synthase large subunit, partial [Synergistaceae bacterium]|nr:carbamoyl-phosphate synthase large subunit [Synergistaceae bacterium]